MKMMQNLKGTCSPGSQASCPHSEVVTQLPPEKGHHSLGRRGFPLGLQRGSSPLLGMLGVWHLWVKAEMEKHTSSFSIGVPHYVNMDVAMYCKDLGR